MHNDNTSDKTSIDPEPSNDPNTYRSSEPRTVTNKEPNYDAMRPLFAWLPVDVIKETFAVLHRWPACPWVKH